MSNGRTYWWAKDAGWWRREWIVELGLEFGADGPAVIDWLACEAKSQNDGGRVSAGVKTVSRGCFVDVVTVSHILSHAVTLGLLEEHESREGRFTCRISGWKVEQDRFDARSRKADQRARQSTNTGDQPSDVTVSHAESRPVTECPPTGQDSTGKTTANAVVSSRRSRDEIERDKATDDDRRLCRLFAELARANNPKLKIANDATWLRSVRLMREQDDHTVDELEQTIRWVFEDPSDDAQFWSSTIQAPAGLRDHFGQVWGRMHKPARQPASPAISELDQQRLAAMNRVIQGEAA